MRLASIIKRKIRLRKPRRVGMTLLFIAVEDGYEYEYWVPAEWQIPWNVILPMCQESTRSEGEAVIKYLTEINA